MIVKESLYNFKREQDPIASSGLGKITLIKNWLDKYGITKYVINDDFSIDCDNTVSFGFEGLNNFPEFIKFNLVKGHFRINDNNFVNLIGCPKICLGNFNITNNPLLSLEGCPIKVVGDFWYTTSKNINKFNIQKICNVTGNIKIGE